MAPKSHLPECDSRCVGKLLSNSNLSFSVYIGASKVNDDCALGVVGGNVLKKSIASPGNRTDRIAVRLEDSCD